MYKWVNKTWNSVNDVLYLRKKFLGTNEELQYYTVNFLKVD